MPATTSATLGLLYVANGSVTARWNFPEVRGHRFDSGEGIGEAVDIDVRFLASAPSYYSAVAGFQKFSAVQTQAANAVLAAIEQVADIDFHVVKSGTGDITFGNSYQQQGQGGFAYSPSYAYLYAGGGKVTSVSENKTGGDVWINRNAPWSATDWQPGGDGYATLLHEVGHALGLKHSFEGTYRLTGSLDSERFTVMSYTHATKATLIEVEGSKGNHTWEQVSLRPSTLMMADIAALQHLYGANTATRAGNTSYRWDQNEELLETIWDGGGKDTIDCSNQVFSNVINLDDGSFSSIALRQTASEIRSGLGLPSWFTSALPSNTYDGSNNLGIALGVVIENASGGSGRDKITGNEAANYLKGNGGNDTLAGGAGKDTLSGGEGNDRLTGGSGRDQLTGGAGKDIFDFNAVADTGTTSSKWDVITDFVRGQDHIDLSTIDAKATASGNNAFTFIGSSAFTGAGQLRYAWSASKDYGVLYGNTDKDSAAEFAIQVSGVSGLGAGDFIA